VVFKKQIISLINYYLQIDITGVTDLDFKDAFIKKKDYIDLLTNTLQLKAVAVELLDAMLEKVSDDTERLTHLIAEGLDIPALQHSMADFHVLSKNADLKDAKADDNALRALFKAYSIINHFISRKVKTQYKLGEPILCCA